jgi:hypothetical protein
MNRWAHVIEREDWTSAFFALFSSANRQLYRPNRGDCTAPADSGFTVNGTSSAVFRAGNPIHLGPGFSATAGTASTTFRAVMR